MCQIEAGLTTTRRRSPLPFTRYAYAACAGAWKVNYTWNWANLVARPLCQRLRFPLFVCGWPNRAKPMHLGAQEQRPKQQQQQREQQEKHQRRRLTFSKGRQCHPCSVNGIYRWEQRKKTKRRWFSSTQLLFMCDALFVCQADSFMSRNAFDLCYSFVSFLPLFVLSGLTPKLLR